MLSVVGLDDVVLEEMCRTATQLTGKVGQRVVMYIADDVIKSYHAGCVGGANCKLSLQTRPCSFW